MNKIKIIKKAEFNYSRSAAGANPKWPLGDLEVGDGFYVGLEFMNQVRCSIQHFQRWYPGKKFRTKQQDNKVLVKRVS